MPNIDGASSKKLTRLEMTELFVGSDDDTKFNIGMELTYDIKESETEYRRFWYMAIFDIWPVYTNVH